MRNQPRVFVRPEVFEAAAMLRPFRSIPLRVRESTICTCGEIGRSPRLYAPKDDLLKDDVSPLSDCCSFAPRTNLNR